MIWELSKKSIPSLLDLDIVTQAPEMVWKMKLVNLNSIIRVDNKKDVIHITNDNKKKVYTHSLLDKLLPSACQL